ncbi:MAG: DUF3857 and transglutaminase domain-containing protein [Ignavibacteriaceae bacterium]|nr:DUF3857 and transglutaminase domain-containing protein [Ignavibacteriaceae bacterium]
MRIMFVLLTAAILSFALLSCSSVTNLDLNKIKSELNLKEFPGQKDYPEADALVLKEEHNINIAIEGNKDTLSTEKFYKVVKLFKNIDHFADVEVSVEGGDEIYDLHARTIQPDSTITELKEEDFHTINGGGDNVMFYTDEKDVKFTLPALEKDCIIEYGYTIKEKNPYMDDLWDIQDDNPKLQSIYKITFPKVFLKNGNPPSPADGLRYCAYNCSLDKPAAQSSNGSGKDTAGTISYTWVQKNIPAFEPESKMPPYSQYLRYAEFSPRNWNTWNDFSKWYYFKYYKPRLNITDLVKQKALEITSGCKDETEKIRSLYNFVQTFRYIAIKLGKAGITPAEPETVLEHKYGDCKDKATLLVALLKSVGINAKPVLVLTADDGRINENFPSMKFNHVIAKAITKDGKDYWMDATVDHCRLGCLPYECENIKVLVLNDDGTSQIEKTPKSNFDENVENIKMKIDLTNRDSTNFDIAMTVKGQENLEYRSLFSEKTSEEILKYCKMMVSDNYLNAKVTNYDISDPDSVDSDFVLHFQLKVPNIIENQGDYSFLNIDPFQFAENLNWLGKEERKYDIEFSYPHMINKSIEVILPENKYKITNLPADLDLNEKGLGYFKKYQAKNDNMITTVEQFSVREKNIAADSYKDVRNFFNGVRSKSNEKIVLTKK